MADDDKITLPPGYTLEGDSDIKPPPGFTLEGSAPPAATPVAAPQYNAGQQQMLEGRSGEAFKPLEGSGAQRFGQGFWANTGQALLNNGKALADIIQVAQGLKRAPDPETKELVKGLYQSQVDQFDKGKELWHNAHSTGDYSEAFGHFLASALPLIGPAAAHAAERMGGDIPQYDKYGNVVKQGQTPDVAGGAGEATPIVASAAAPLLKGPVKGAVKSVVSKFPSTARAGTTFDTVTQAAGKTPLNLSEPLRIATEAEKMAQSGGHLPKVMSDFLDRMRNTKQAPINFEDGRRFYTNSTALSGEENLRLKPQMKMQVGDFTKALDSSLRDAAHQSGVGDQYAQAMKEYRQAARNKATMRTVKDVAGKTAVKGAIGAAGAGLTGGAMYELWDKLFRAKGGSIVDRQPTRDRVLPGLQRFDEGGAASDTIQLGPQPGAIPSGLAAAGPNLDLRPTQARPLSHPVDPQKFDEAMNTGLQYGIPAALTLGTAGVGGPATMSLESMAPIVAQALLGPFTHASEGTVAAPVAGVLGKEAPELGDKTIELMGELGKYSMERSGEERERMRRAVLQKLRGRHESAEEKEPVLKLDPKTLWPARRERQER